MRVAAAIVMLTCTGWAWMGGSGILFTQLLAADAGETAAISFSGDVKVHQDFPEFRGGFGACGGRYARCRSV